MEQAAQVKRKPIWWDSLKKMINFIYKKTFDNMEKSQPTWGYSRKKNKQEG